MHPRTLLLLLAVGALAAPAAGQSNVRPATRLVRVPELGASLLAPGSPRESAFRPGERGADDPEAPAEPAGSSGFAHVQLTGSVYDNASFQRGGGDVATSRGGWSAVFGERAGSETLYAVSLDLEASFYDFSGAQALNAGSPDPFNDVYESRFGAVVVGDPLARRTLFAGAELSLSGEDDADLRDALAVAAVGGVRVQFTDRASFSLGLAGRSRLEDDPWLAPYLGFDLRLADGLRLESDGSSVRAIATPADGVEVFLGAAYEIRQFRLNERSTLPSGVVQDEEIRGEAGVTWRFAPRATLRLSGGTTLWRELSSYSDAGVKLSEVETDPALIGSLSLSIVL